MPTLTDSDTASQNLADYEPTKAGRAISDFVDEHLSNWYVRLCRRRFWKGDYSQDKISAYQTLYRCLEVVAQLGSPIAPFFMERLFVDLNQRTGRQMADSVHLTAFPQADFSVIDKDLEERMELAQKISSMALSIRKKMNIRVRQPLNKIIIPLLSDHLKYQMDAVKHLIISEVNVKTVDYIEDTAGILVKTVKPDFKKLGSKYGKLMKPIAEQMKEWNQGLINAFEKTGEYSMAVENQQVHLKIEEVEIRTEDLPGFQTATMGSLVVALDTTITPELWREGIAREVINRIQNLRKDKKFEVTDKISVKFLSHPGIDEAVNQNISYICSEILAQSFEVVALLETEEKTSIELTDTIGTYISIRKVD